MADEMKITDPATPEAAAEAEAKKKAAAEKATEAKRKKAEAEAKKKADAEKAAEGAEAEAKKAGDAEKAAKAERKRQEAEAKKAAEKEAKENAPYVEIAKRYAEHYPACKAFHITSDKQVFLEADKAEAEAHQREIGKGKVRTINVE